MCQTLIDRMFFYLTCRDCEVELEEGGEVGASAEPVVATGKKGKGKKKKGFADL